MNQKKTNLIPYKGYLSAKVDWQCFHKLAWITDDARSMGIHIMAGKGSGKSRLMGRVIGWLDFIRGIPQVIFDPHGPTIDNFIDKFLHMPPEIQKKLLPRVLYVDMSGKDGAVIPFPLFYRFGSESLYEISQRHLDVIRKIDPFLQTASIEGWNPLWRIGTCVGMVLAALGCQITEAEDILMDFEQWESRIAEAVTNYPELTVPFEYFKSLLKEKDNVRSRKMESYLNKIAIFTLDDSMKAMFGSNHIGVNWDEILEKRITVLFDFRHDHDIERKRFKMVWAFNYLLDFIKHRGAGRHQPIGLIIDELTSLFSLQSLNSDLFGYEMDELVNVLARNYRLWLTIAHQEKFQLSDRIFNSLMTMGTQIVGVTTDPFAAKYLSDFFFKYKPYWIKKYEPIYASVDGMVFLIDNTTVEFTLEEQSLIQSYLFLEQKAFEFFIRIAKSEGNIQSTLRKISIARFDQGIFPHPYYVPSLCQKLMREKGDAIQDILKEISDRKIHNGVFPKRQELPREVDVPLWN